MAFIINTSLNSNGEINSYRIEEYVYAEIIEFHVKIKSSSINNDTRLNGRTRILFLQFVHAQARFYSLKHPLQLFAYTNTPHVFGR